MVLIPVVIAEEERSGWSQKNKMTLKISEGLFQHIPFSLEPTHLRTRNCRVYSESGLRYESEHENFNLPKGFIGIFNIHILVRYSKGKTRIDRRW
jgi:hypothetical protein